MADAYDILAQAQQGGASSGGDDTEAAHPRQSQHDTSPKLEKLLQPKVSSDASKHVDERAHRQTQRPTGLKRELFDLVGGRTPLVPTTSYTTDKAKLGATAASKWVWSPFRHPARKDKLVLYHWVEADRVSEPYAYAKFNRHRAEVPYISPVDYKAAGLEDADWTMEETRLLLELCRRFDRRFILVRDRFVTHPSVRSTPSAQKSVEAIKARFYVVAAKVAKFKGATDADPVVSYRYDHEHERKRKEQITRINSRTLLQYKEQQELREKLGEIRKFKKEQGLTPQPLSEQIKAAPAPAEPDTSAGDANKPKRPKTEEVTIVDVSTAAKHPVAEPRRVSTARQTSWTQAQFESVMEAASLAVSLQTERVHGPVSHAHADAQMAQYLNQKCQDLKIVRPLPTEKVGQLYDEVRNSLVELGTAMSRLSTMQKRLLQLHETRNRLLKERGVEASAAKPFTPKRTLSSSLASPASGPASESFRP